MNSKSIRFSRAAGMEVQKRNITDTETPVLEKVALEEQLKEIKHDLEDNDNGLLKFYVVISTNFRHPDSRLEASRSLGNIRSSSTRLSY